MNTERIITMAKDLFREERALMRLDGWFLSKEIYPRRRLYHAGTFVNFLDLSPAIQQYIIKRLDLKSTTGVSC